MVANRCIRLTVPPHPRGPCCARLSGYEPDDPQRIPAGAERLAASPKLSKDLYEVVSKALA